MIFRDHFKWSVVVNALLQNDVFIYRTTDFAFKWNINLKFASTQTLDCAIFCKQHAGQSGIKFHNHERTIKSNSRRKRRFNNFWIFRWKKRSNLCSKINQISTRKINIYRQKCSMYRMWILKFAPNTTDVCVLKRQWNSPYRITVYMWIYSIGIHVS